MVFFRVEQLTVALFLPHLGNNKPNEEDHVDKRMILAFLLLLIVLLPLRQSVASLANTYYFTCNHPTEGDNGLTGQSRATYMMARQDELKHLNDHADHKGYTTVVTKQ